MSNEFAPGGPAPLDDELPPHARALLPTDPVDYQAIPGTHDVSHGHLSSSPTPGFQVYEEAKFEGIHDGGAKEPDIVVSPDEIMQGSEQKSASQLNAAAPVFVPMSQTHGGGHFEQPHGFEQPRGFEHPRGFEYPPGFEHFRDFEHLRGFEDRRGFENYGWSEYPRGFEHFRAFEYVPGFEHPYGFQHPRGLEDSRSFENRRGSENRRGLEPTRARIGSRDAVSNLTAWSRAGARGAFGPNYPMMQYIPVDIPGPILQLPMPVYEGPLYIGAPYPARQNMLPLFPTAQHLFDYQLFLAARVRTLLRPELQPNRRDTRPQHQALATQYVGFYVNPGF